MGVPVAAATAVPLAMTRRAGVSIAVLLCLPVGFRRPLLGLPLFVRLVALPVRGESLEGVQQPGGLWVLHAVGEDALDRVVEAARRVAVELGAEAHEVEPGLLHVLDGAGVTAPITPAALVARLAAAGVEVDEIAAEAPTLEEVFVSLVREVAA
jgi:hypothetical protein